MKYLAYLLFRFFVVVFRILPYSAIYGISNVLAFLLQYVVRYRKELVAQNIKLAFPLYSSEEIEDILKESYRNLSDIIVEGVKGMSISKKILKKRYKFTNPELLDSAYENGKSVILATGHYNNWEWGALSSSLFFKHNSVGIYKKLSNPFTDSYMKKSRGIFGLHLVEMRETRKGFEKFVSQARPGLFLMAGDQHPSNVKKALWTEFLGQKTACLHGIEEYSKLYNLPIVYAKIMRVKRGYYEVFLKWIIQESEDAEKGESTALFMKELESSIIQEPGNWLWSHKRWKAKYEGQEIYIVNPEKN